MARRAVATVGLPWAPLGAGRANVRPESPRSVWDAGGRLVRFPFLVADE